MKKTQKIQIVYAGLTNLCQHSTTDLARGIITTGHKQSALSKTRSFKHSKTTSSFLYSIHHQRAGKTIHMRGVDYTHFNTCCTFKFSTFCVNICFVILPAGDNGRQLSPAPRSGETRSWRGCDQPRRARDALPVRGARGQLSPGARSVCTTHCIPPPLLGTSPRVISRQ